MKNKIIGTEFTGQHHKIRASGALKDLGIKDFFSPRDVDLAAILSYLSGVEPEMITEHTYRFGRYMVKFYPPESFGFLGYCQSLGLPVESPVAMGVNNDNVGDIVIIDRINGRDYKEIVLDDKRSSFLRTEIPHKELKALGRTVYLFCLKGIIAGDSKLENYMYNGEEAVRIDLIPQYDSMSGINWKEISENPGKVQEALEALVGMMSDIFCLLRDLAEVLTHQKQSRKRFLEGANAFLQGFVNDELSRIFASELLEHTKQIADHIQEAEKGSRSFQEVFLSHAIEEAAKQGGEVNIRIFGH